MENNPSENATAERTDETTEFVHRATSENIVDNSTYIDHPSVNGNPNAILLVARGSLPSGGANGTHDIGVWYDASRGGRWTVFNQDRASMPEGTTFDVAVREEPGGTIGISGITMVTNYGYKLWAYRCDYNDGNGSLVNALWTPDLGYLTQGYITSPRRAR